jgi:hypothetical protein
LKTQQKRTFPFVRDQEASKKWYKEKSEELKSDFQKNIFTVKITYKESKLIQWELLNI